MARNRKNQTAAVRFGPALKAFCLCLFLGGSGVGYVWQKEQIQILGQELRLCETQYEKLHRQNEILSRVLASLQAPGELEARIRQMDLGLVAPQPDQIVRLVEVWPATDNRSPDLLYAEEQSPALARH